MIVDNTYTRPLTVDDSRVAPMTAGTPQTHSIFTAPNTHPGFWTKDAGFNSIADTKIHIAADQIVVNGKPLSQIIADLQQKVALLKPALDLHEEYEELREIYAQYNKKLDEIREKKRMWETLKK